jgi:hypothetical protein
MTAHDLDFDIVGGHKTALQAAASFVAEATIGSTFVARRAGM